MYPTMHFAPHSWLTRQTGLTRWTPFRVRRTTGSSLCRDRTARATANGAKAPPHLLLPRPSRLSWRHRQQNTTSLNNNSSVKLVQWNQRDQWSHFRLLGVGYNSVKLDQWNQSDQRSHFLLETGGKTGKHREVSHQGMHLYSRKFSTDKRSKFSQFSYIINYVSAKHKH